MLCEKLVHAYNNLQYDDEAVAWVVRGYGNPYPCAWSDEHPSTTGGLWPGRHKQCEGTIHRLIRVRQDLWRYGCIPDDDEEFWGTIRLLLPAWPGFRRLQSPPVSAGNKFVMDDIFRFIFDSSARRIDERLCHRLGITPDEEGLRVLPAGDADARAPIAPTDETAEMLSEARKWYARQQRVRSWLNEKPHTEMAFRHLEQYDRVMTALWGEAKRLEERLGWERPRHTRASGDPAEEG